MTDGTWWDHWAGWMIARAGEERPRVLGLALGVYVFEKV
jgi:poly(3-hydroxyalkanoate) synthetase